MSATLSNKARTEPNLTPVLDMVFQLITFFMLVINFKANMVDKQMELPVVGSARPLEKPENRSFFMVNLNNRGEFTVLGRPYADDAIAGYIARQAGVYQLAERRLNADFDPAKDDLTATVIVRADKATPFATLYRVVKECQSNGFRTFAFRAMDKAKRT